MADNQEDKKKQESLNKEQEVLLKKIKALYSEIKDLGEGINKIHEQRNKLTDELITSEGESRVLDAQKIKNLQKHIDLQKQIIQNQIALGEGDREQLAIQLEALEDQEAKIRLLEEEEKIVKENLKTTLGMRDINNTIFAKIKEIQQIGKLSLSDEKEREQLQKQYFASKSQDLIEGIVNLSKIMFDKATELDNAMRGLMREAGFSYEDARRGILDTQASMVGAAVSTEALAKTMGSLRTSFSGYTNLTASQKTNVESMVAVLDKMGLSAETSSKFLDTATKSLGMSLNQSSNFLSSLKGFADQSGISLQRLSQDLAANASELTKFGKEGVTIFKELELASKNLGIEMSKLLQITEQFTTFEGAAIAAGKFNALLGGDFINSVDLLTASMEDPVESFRMFKEAMDQSGNSFDDMDNGMKRVVAQALGMSVEEAGKLFSQDINTATRAMREQAATQEKLNELSGKMSNFTDKLQAAFVALYPALVPILDALSKLGDFLIEAATAIGEFMKEHEGAKDALYAFGVVIAGAAGIIITVTTVLLPLIATVGSMKVLFGGLGGIIKFAFSPFVEIKDTLKSFFSASKEASSAAQDLGDNAKEVGAKMKELGSSGESAKEGLDSVGEGSEKAGKGAKMSAGQIAALGFAVLLIGAGIAVAALGLSELVSSFKGLGDAAWPAAAAVIGFTVAFTIMIVILTKLALSGAGPIAVALLIGIGQASLMIGGGMALAAAGFALYNESQRRLLETGKETVDTMNSLSDSTIQRYKDLVEIFKDMAVELEKVSNTGVLDKLNSSAFSIVVEKIFGTSAKMQGASAGIELSVGSPSKTSNTSLEKQDQQIVVNVKIDSPIEIDGRKLGNWIAENKTVIQATNKALNAARQGA